MTENIYICGSVDPLLVEVVREKAESLLPVCFRADPRGSYTLRLSVDPEVAGFRISIGVTEVLLAGATKPDLLYACGEYIRLCLSVGRLVREPREIDEKPAIPWRVIYAPGHFRNSYEASTPEEMRSYIYEAAFWGANVWGEWFDYSDGVNPYHGERSDNERTKWYFDTKKEVLSIVQEAGMKVMVIMTPNHVYIDQLDKELLAQKKPAAGTEPLGPTSVIGNLVCPSKAEGLKLILDNHREFFRDLAESGISVDLGCYFFYDYGGCLCDVCHPWVETGLRLQTELSALARTFFPKIEFTICGWYLNPREIAIIERFFEQGKIPWASGLQIALSGGSRNVKPMADLKHMGKELFVNLGYSSNNVDDVYGLCGAVMAPERLSRIIGDAKAGECRTLVCYGEGIHDDVNKCLSMKLAYQRDADSAAILASYCRWYYGLAGATAKECARILAEMEHMAFTARPDLEARLSEVASDMTERARSSWRYRHLEYRLALCRIDSMLGRTPDWEQGLLDLVKERSEFGDILTEIRAYLERKRSLFAERDRVYREMNRSLYGLEGLFDFFNYHKRKALRSWIARIRTVCERLPSGASSGLVLEALAKEGVKGVRTID